MNSDSRYDFLVVGAGLSGAVFARLAMDKGYSCLVIDRRPHVGGNCYCESVDGINVHKYGAHIFRTDNPRVWGFVNRFADFNHFVNSPVANFKGELFNLPFNMNTFYQLWGVVTPDEAKRKIDEQRVRCDSPANLEQHVLNLAGRDIYEKLVKGYTEKQWGKKCSELPPDIMKRIPLRFRYDNNYYNERIQGIPYGGYNPMFERLLKGAKVYTGVDFNAGKNRKRYSRMARRIVYTGALDEYFGYRYGALEYRSLRFEHRSFNVANVQGVAVMNYTDAETPYTRTIEHKHFEFGTQPTSIVSYEYPEQWSIDKEPYYPVNSESNNIIYKRYLLDASKQPNLIVCGRLGDYSYYDMSDTIWRVMELAKGVL